MPVKPKYGKPCNHCGECCKAELCEAAKMIYADKIAPCPALTDDNMCGLVISEIASGMKPILQLLLGIGIGCSMTDDDTTEEEVKAFDVIFKAKNMPDYLRLMAE